MRNDPFDFVTVATTWYPIRAWLIRNRLADEGIDAIVTDECLVTMDWLTANAIGGIKVQVPRAQLESAHAALEHNASVWLPIAVTAKSDVDHCPSCQSIDVCDERYSRRAAYLGWFFLGFPLPLRSRRKRCLECGQRFAESKESQPFQFSLMTLMTWVIIAACVCGVLRLAMEGSAGIHPAIGETRKY